MKIVVQGIYKIMYKGKCAYVGSAMDIKRRFQQHKDTLKRKVHRNFVLQRVWNKSKECLELVIVEEVVSQEQLMEREQFYIDTLKPFCNLSKANGSHPHTEESKSKMRGRKFSDEHRKKLSEVKKGKPSYFKKGVPTNFIPSSAFKKGTIPWNKGKKLKPSWNKGKPMTEEHRRKLSEAKKKSWNNPEYKSMMISSRKGHIPTEEHKKKVSEKMKLVHSMYPEKWGKKKVI